MSDRKVSYSGKTSSGKEWQRSDGLENALRKREDYSRNKKWEHGGMYDKDGNPVIEKTSHSKNCVRWSWDECMQAEGNTMTHNHPNDSCFSGADIRFADRWGLMEIRATTSTGKTYCLRRTNPTDAKRKSSASNFGHDYEREYNAYYKNVILKGYEREAAKLPYRQRSEFKTWEEYSRAFDQRAAQRQKILDKWNDRYERWCSAWVRDHAKQYGWSYREEQR